MQQEQIQFSKSRTGTLIRFFSNMMPEDTPDSLPAFAIIDGAKRPLKVVSSEIEASFIRNGDNNFVYDNSYQIISGRTSLQKFDFLLPEERKKKIKNSFISNFVTISGNSAISEVFFENVLIDDFFVDVSVFRDYNTLDTLSVHNVVKGEIPKRESPTGVVFGKLEAFQKLSDENGNKIKIPLKNVPIAIFNTSDQFPSVSSKDEDGNRIRLNIKENSKRELYFNNESFSADTQFLKDESFFENIPDKFKFTSITNEDGEFLLNDVPTGNQVLLFEVDLLKQGLTHDEVALNFFPYPPDDNPNVDTIPHYFFQQLPIGVVASWGDFQTGYTEVNITTNLDLRKWTTYYIAPISNNNKNLDQRTADGIFTPLAVEVRDMSKKDFPITNVQVVEVQNTLEKISEQQLEWRNEFIQMKPLAEFRTHDYHVFKLPANMYDPDGFKTDVDGKTTKSKGVWLSAYQLKMRYNSPKDIFRTTGLERSTKNNIIFTRDNFHLNRGNTDATQKNSAVAPLIGTFPYEKPWTINYPSKYSIPSKPNKAIDVKFDSDGKANPTNQPKFSDGDLVGLSLAEGNASGFGRQLYPPAQVYLNNRFASRVSRHFVYKYENSVAWHEIYASGYNPFLDENHLSQIVNGEKFQRLECGYGYWLKPEGWPLISYNKNGDDIEEKYLTNGVVDSGDGTNFEISVKNFDSRDLALIMDDSAQIKEGGLDVFRIVDARDISDPQPDVISTFVNLNFQTLYFQRGFATDFRLKTGISNSETDNGNEEYFWTSTGQGGIESLNNLRLEIKNNGVKTVTMDIGFLPNITFQPGETRIFDSNQIGLNDDFVLTLEGNDALSADETFYAKANYIIKFRNVKFFSSPSNHVLKDRGTDDVKPLFLGNPIILTADFKTKVPNYYLVTYLENVRTNYNDHKKTCQDDFPGFLNSSSRFNQTVKVNGMAFVNSRQSGGGSWFDSRFESSAVNAFTCANSIDSNGDLEQKLIPFVLA